LMEGLLAMLLSERMGVQINGNGDGQARPEVEALRNQIRQSLVIKEQPAANAALPAIASAPAQPERDS
jgi:hypothetical protein